MQAILFGLTAFLLSLLRQDPMWSAISFLFLFLTLNISKINRKKRTKRKVLKIVLIPLLIGAFSPIYSPLGKVALAAILPILGFMLLFSLLHTSELNTNLHFTSAFIFLFSLAGGALSGIGKYMSDNFLDTTYLLGNDSLMMELLLIMMFGILGTLIFIQYMNSKSLVNQKTNQLRFHLNIKKEYSSKHFFKILNSFFWDKEKASLQRTSKVLQIGILVLVFYNLEIQNFWGYSIALISFILSIFPTLYSRVQRIKLSPSFQFWLASALFLYASGESLRFQSLFGWWNPFTHLIAGIMVGTLVFIYLFYLEDVSENLHIPNRMIPIFVLIFILSLGVLWELFEFLIDSFFGTSLQPNLQNTIYDMIFNTIGAFFALLIASVLTPFEVFSWFNRKNNLFRWKQAIISYLNDVSLFYFGFSSGLIALSLSISRSDWIWAMISLIFIVLTYGISMVGRKRKIKWKVFLWSLIPLFLGAIGIFRISPIYRTVGDLAIAAIIPFLSFMIIFNLTYHTKFKTNFHFSIFLMFIFSLSIGAVLSITKFFSDLYLGSHYLTSVELLMMEFLIITISTLIGIYLVIIYLNKVKDKNSQIIMPFTSRSYLASESPREDFLSLLNSFFGKRLYYDLPWITKVLPFAIILFAIYGFYSYNFRAIVISLPALAFSIIPYISKKGLKKSIPNSFQFWFSIILLIFLIGEILRVYPRFEWWTLVTHLLGGMVITLFVFLGLLYIDQNSDPLEIPFWMIQILSLTALLSVIFLEKLSLFTLDAVIGTNLLGNLNYTILDIMSALIGGVFVLQLIKLEERI